MIVPGVPQLAIIAVIVGLVFGTKRLRDLGGDIGGMFKGIRSGFKEAASAAEELTPELRQLKKDVQTVTQAVKPSEQYAPLFRKSETDDAEWGGDR